jgi:hypothetical protein
MGTVCLVVDDVALELPLGASTRFGRHWSCDGVLHLSAAPLYWIEVRWREDHWSWRTLGASERTRGTGAAEPAGFRSWANGQGRVRLDGCGCLVELRLVDAAPPGLLLEDLDSRKRISEGALERYLEVWPDGRIWPLGAEPGIDPPLADGSVFVRGDRAFRLHRPGRLRDTAEALLDARDRELWLTVDLDTLQAKFAAGEREALVTGECVRVLGVYALARQQDAEGGGGGWMAPAAAHESWIEIGGRASSPIDRLAWERGKLRTRLAAQRMSGLEGLFEMRRGAGSTEIRLALSPGNIDVRGAP